MYFGKFSLLLSLQYWYKILDIKDVGSMYRLQLFTNNVTALDINCIVSWMFKEIIWLAIKQRWLSEFSYHQWIERKSVRLDIGINSSLKNWICFDIYLEPAVEYDVKLIRYQVDIYHLLLWVKEANEADIFSWLSLSLYQLRIVSKYNKFSVSWYLNNSSI